MPKKPTVAGLQRINVGQVDEINHLRAVVDQRERDIKALREKQETELKAYRAQITVLLGDRDRLTATVEILSRRLMSPAAEHDVTRGGWRGANRNLESLR